MKKIDTVTNKNVFFISYRRNTSGSIANAVADKLVDRYKFEVFFDKHDRTVGEVEDKLKDAIDKCTHFILFVDENTFIDKGNQESETNQSKDNDYVLFEIQQALKKRKSEKSIEIIPILVNGYKMPSKNDKRLANNNIAEIAGFEWIDYDEKNDSHNDVTKKILERIGYDEYKEMRHKDKVKKIKLSIVVILSAAAFLFGGTLLQKYITSKTPKLIFAGGGSVANLINEIVGDSVFINEYPNSIYLNLPSKDAWALMTQEVLSNHMSDGNKFCPVCLSAVKAHESDFTKTIYNIEDFLKKGTIIEYKFKKEDTLKVFVDSTHKKELDNLCLKDGRISKESLETKIKEWCNNPKDSIKIYITRERSGTYCTYEELFPDIFKDSKLKKDHLTFYDDSLSSDYLNGKNYIVLSSYYYTPERIRKLYSIEIVDSAKIKSKPMYLYFVARKYPSINPYNNQYIIPDEMVQFIKRIEKDKTIAPLINANRKVITSINSLKIDEQE